ncbi:MAG: DUF4426 domain-containing protein [Pseudomarimonas sp.]
MHRICRLLLAALATLMPISNTLAQATAEIGAHTLHVNAISTLEISPDVARASAITRSASRGLLNIAVRRLRDDGSDVATRATVTADAINLSGQRQILSLREVREGDAIYYLAEPRIAEAEELTFEISARPEGDASILKARFKKTFFAPLPP